MIVITGATGHIGNVLVRRLLAQGKTNIRTLILPGEDTGSLTGLSIELVKGDITNYESLVKAFTGAEQVYHLAGVIAISGGREHLMEKVNVGGTQNVINACLQCGVKKILYTSTIHAIKEPPKGQQVTERLPFLPDEKKEGYDKSKARATLEVIKAIKEKNLNAVIVCPSGVIGPYDFKISKMGELFIQLVNKKLKAYVDGSYDFVDVRDVARGMTLAMDKGRTGETYLLTGQQITVKQIMEAVEQATGVPAPTTKLPIWLAYLSAFFAPLYYKLARMKPLYTRYSIHTLASNSNASNAKAKQELGYTTRPIEQSIKDSLQWLKENDKIKFYPASE
ncbi:SDR family oxidoreductase [Patescibacteria group bacterium]|nr:SDR family oxidoreductase [Patescibacteria group bacterium]MBU0964363.1 SDR family oxidoreductase [Patescibacteria group bacterium]